MPLLELALLHSDTLLLIEAAVDAAVNRPITKSAGFPLD
jgi:hypothetical protein